MDNVIVERSKEYNIQQQSLKYFLTSNTKGTIIENHFANITIFHENAIITLRFCDNNIA